MRMPKLTCVLSYLAVLISLTWAAECVPRATPDVCTQNLTCINGRCAPTLIGPPCDCDPGWAGQTCDTCCGDRCDTDADLPPFLFPVAPGPDDVTPDTIVTSDDDVPEGNCTKTGTEYAECGMHRCFHGNCSRLISGVFDLSKCVCSDGWHGRSCDKCCDLTCGEHGQCHLTLEAKTPYCACEVTYSGRLCDVHAAEVTCNSTVKERDDGSEYEYCGGAECYNGFCERGTNPDTGLPWAKCICEPGWTGHYCEDCCDITCYNNGSCEARLNGTKYCNCNTNTTGWFCEEFTTASPVSLYSQPIESQTPWEVIGATLAVLVTLIVLFFVVLLIMYQKRVEIVMKIIYALAPYANENDGKQYDAFVSYRSDEDDQTFVVRQLLPKLEKEMGFKICFHARDFVPGITIAENIMSAIEQSRRTIILISPAYCQETLGEWPIFEVLKAHEEMLKSRSTIIPIMFKKVDPASRTVHPVLQNILQNITWLEWPGPNGTKALKKFWNKLYLSMPKKKRLFNRDAETAADTTGTETTRSRSVFSCPCRH